MRKITLIAFMMLLSAPIATAQNVLVIGAGAASCGSWLEYRNKPALYQQMKQWVMGFISGSNWRTDKMQTRPTDEDAIVHFVDLYCTNNPLHGLALAVAAEIQETGGPKTDHQWKR